jgi:hypothetical protein
VATGDAANGGGATGGGVALGGAAAGVPALAALSGVSAGDSTCSRLHESQQDIHSQTSAGSVLDIDPPIGS